MLQLAHVEGVVTIPVEAIVLNDRQPTVYALDAANHIHIRNVQVGLEGSKLAEITGGLQPGDRVLIGGQEKYADNEEVNPLMASTPSSERMRQAGGTIDLKADDTSLNPKEGGSH
jgi:hypothetical protein